MPEIEPPLDRRRLSDERERQRAIEKVLRDQAHRQMLRDVASRGRRPSLAFRIVARTLAVAALVAWLIPVPGLQPEIPFPLPPAEEETGLRLTTWVQAQQVEAFRQRRGRLPDVLRETGEPLTGMTYERVDAHTYQLRGETGHVSITWLSRDTLDTRLHDAATRLRGQRE